MALSQGSRVSCLEVEVPSLWAMRHWFKKETTTSKAKKQRHYFADKSLSSQSYGEGNGNPLQYSCLENPMDGEAW